MIDLPNWWGTPVKQNAIYPWRVDRVLPFGERADHNKGRGSQKAIRNFVMKHLTALVAVCGLLWCSSLRAQQPSTKPKELDILGQYVGHWTSDVTNKPAIWDQNGTKYRTVNQAELILDGWFLQHIEVNHVVGDPSKVTKSLFLWTYEPVSRKYEAWTFQSTGNVASSTGTWEATNKTFTLTSVEPPPKTSGKFTELFLDANTIEGNLTFLDDGGKTLMDMGWTRKRQAEGAGRGTREQWSKLGMPPQPLPGELKKLQPMIGEWDTEFIESPSAAAPEAGTSKGKTTAQWILDGHFLLGTTQQKNDRSLWIIGYDTAKLDYHQIRFTSTGRIDESRGYWNGEFDTVDWKNHLKRPGYKASITQDYIGVERDKDGKETLRSSILIRDEKEKAVLRSLTTKSTRVRQ
jgi:hypothetical protein